MDSEGLVWGLGVLGVGSQGEGATTVFDTTTEDADSYA